MQNFLLVILIIVTGLTSSMLIYVFERLRIPKLKFAGFFKIDSSEVGATATKDLTRFFIKVINFNKRSEGNVQGCVGFINLDNKTYRTVWQYDYAANTFGQEALLLVFYIDKNHNTINFVNYQQSQQIIEPKSFDECIKNSITIRLESSRGHCPKPLTLSIESIINNAEMI